jgi:antirestriction protein ArdC
MINRTSDVALWAGFAQAKAKGWFPKKGSKGCYAIRPQLNSREVEGEDGKPVKDDNGETVLKSWVSWKPVCLFNALDLEGEGLQDAINAIVGTVDAPNEFEIVANAERALQGWHETTECKLAHGGDRAYYSPSGDRIQLPDRAKFKDAQGFYATWAHEIVHSTGHSLRLKRDGITGDHPFGSEGYAREELVAELGAFLVTSRLEISCEIEHHASYLQCWIKALRADPKVLFKVLSDANRAANLVIADTVTAE